MVYLLYRHQSALKFTLDGYLVVDSEASSESDPFDDWCITTIIAIKFVSSLNHCGRAASSSSSCLE